MVVCSAKTNSLTPPSFSSPPSQWDRLAKLAGDTPPSAVPEPRADPERVLADVNAALLDSFSLVGGAEVDAADRARSADSDRADASRLASSHDPFAGDGPSAAADLLAARLELADLRRAAEASRASLAAAGAEAQRRAVAEARHAAVPEVPWRWRSTILTNLARSPVC